MQRWRTLFLFVGIGLTIIVLLPAMLLLIESLGPGFLPGGSVFERLSMRIICVTLPLCSAIMLVRSWQVHYQQRYGAAWALCFGALVLASLQAFMWFMLQPIVTAVRA